MSTTTPAATLTPTSVVLGKKITVACTDFPESESLRAHVTNAAGTTVADFYPNNRATSTGDVSFGLVPDANDWVGDCSLEILYADGSGTVLVSGLAFTVTAGTVTTPVAAVVSISLRNPSQTVTQGSTYHIQGSVLTSNGQLVRTADTITLLVAGVAVTTTTLGTSGDYDIPVTFATVGQAAYTTEDGTIVSRTLTIVVTTTTSGQTLASISLDQEGATTVPINSSVIFNGTALDTAGAPIANQSIQPMENNVANGAAVSTNDDGDFTFTLQFTTIASYSITALGVGTTVSSPAVVISVILNATTMSITISQATSS